MEQQSSQVFSFLGYEQETYKIIGAALEVAKNLGSGFLESVYHEAMAIELSKQRIPYKAQEQLVIMYKGMQLEKTFIADFLCYELVIVELKAIREITKREQAQLLNYLRAANSEIGIILNFGSRKLTWKRMINSQ